MIKQKIDIIKALAERGQTQYRILHDGIMGSAMLTKIRRGGLPSYGTLDTICRLLDCQPGDLLEYVPEPDTPAEGSQADHV